MYALVNHIGSKDSEKCIVPEIWTGNLGTARCDCRVRSEFAPHTRVSGSITGLSTYLTFNGKGIPSASKLVRKHCV